METDQTHFVEEVDINTHLIYLVKEYPFIYDAKDPRHKDRDLLERSWTTIASQIYLPVEEAKTKWQRLRNNFSKALERRVHIPRSGSAATKLKKPWVYEADMEFLRSHLHYNRASLAIVKRHAPSPIKIQPLSPEPDMSVHDVLEHSPESTMADNSLSEITVETDPCRATPQRPKARRIEQNEIDSHMLSLINREASASRWEEKEDPVVGWFKSLLPMYNELSSVEKLEFQSKVTLELRNFLLAKEQRNSVSINQPMSSTSTNANTQLQENFSTEYKI